MTQVIARPATKDDLHEGRQLLCPIMPRAGEVAYELWPVVPTSSGVWLLKTNVGYTRLTPELLAVCKVPCPAKKIEDEQL